MFGSMFWKATAERAVKTFAQTLTALLGAGQVGLMDADWAVALSTAGMATLLSVLSSVGSTHVGDSSDPSALHEVSRPHAPHVATG